MNSEMEHTKVVYFNENGDLIAAIYEPSGELTVELTEETSDFEYSRTFSAVAVRSAIYTLGWRKHFFKLELDNGIWETETIAVPAEHGQLYGRPPAHLHGSEPALAVIDDRIYACGGGWRRAKYIATLCEKAPRFSKKCEFYDVTRRTWRDIADMLREKRRHSVIAVNGRLYSVGGLGRGEDGDRPLRNVEEYNPDTDEWTEKCPLIKARVGPGLAEHNGVIYAIGGGSGVAGGRWPKYGRLRCIECYIIASDQWVRTEFELSVGRMLFNPFIINNEIIAIGGDRSTSKDDFSNGSTWEIISLYPNPYADEEPIPIPGAASIRSLAVVLIR